jgi:hypothetical protein
MSTTKTRQTHCPSGDPHRWRTPLGATNSYCELCGYFPGPLVVKAKRPLLNQSREKPRTEKRIDPKAWRW